MILLDPWTLKDECTPSNLFRYSMDIAINDMEKQEQHDHFVWHLLLCNSYTN